uniref:Uncharacterized protein n=1 Tax=Lotharella globosa TaxID=91324 RepID=A0A7S3YFV6_9EUKA|mmetsp:Transcript_19096/g.38609  ORF Transcript_19096/g.38609 Transcript_19096/m.38609 type:complete len:397 (+) Transcript_19096:135-1325(+)
MGSDSSKTAEIEAKAKALEEQRKKDEEKKRILREKIMSNRSKTLQHPLKISNQGFVMGKPEEKKDRPGTSPHPLTSSKTKIKSPKDKSKKDKGKTPSPRSTKAKNRRYSSKTMPALNEILGTPPHTGATLKKPVRRSFSKDMLPSSLTSPTIASAAKSKRAEDIETTKQNFIHHKQKQELVMRRRQRAMSMDLRRISNSPSFRKMKVTDIGESKKRVNSGKSRSPTHTNKKRGSRYGSLTSPLKKSSSMSEKALQAKIDDLENQLATSKEELKDAKEQVEDLQEKLDDYQRRFIDLKRKHAKYKAKAKSKVERVDMAAIKEYQMMEVKLQSMQYQLYYGDTKKDRQIEELERKVEHFTQNYTRRNDAKVTELKTKINEIRTKAIEDWMFSGNQEHI